MTSVSRVGQVVSRRRFLVVVGAAASALAACGGGSATAPASSAVSSPASASSAPTAIRASSQASASAPAAASASANRSAAPLSPPVTVNLGLVSIFDEGGFYLAMERGYFKDEGLDVKVTPRMSGPDTMTQLGAGHLDIGTGTPNGLLFNVIAREIPLKIIASSSILINQYNSSALMVRQDLLDSGRFKGPKDLKGMTVGIASRGTTVDFAIERYLAQANLTEADITYQPLGNFPNILQALTNKALDAGWEVQPFISTLASTKAAAAVVQQRELWPGGLVQGILLAPHFAQSNPEAVKRFLVGFVHGQRDFIELEKTQDGKQQAAQIINKYAPTQNLQSYIPDGSPGADPNADVPAAPLEQLQGYLLRIGIQKAKLDVNTAIDKSYLQYALDRLGRVSS